VGSGSPAADKHCTPSLIIAVWEEMPSGGLGICQEFRQIPENQMKDGPGKKKAQGEAPLGSRRFADTTSLIDA